MLSWGAGGTEHKLRSSKPPTPHESCVSRIKYNDGDCEPPPLLQEKIRIAATEKLHKLLPRRRRCWKTMGQNSNNQVGWEKKMQQQQEEEEKQEKREKLKVGAQSPSRVGNSRNGENFCF